MDLVATAGVLGMFVALVSMVQAFDKGLGFFEAYGSNGAGGNIGLFLGYQCSYNCRIE